MEERLDRHHDIEKKKHLPFSWSRLVVFVGAALLIYKAVGPGSTQALLMGVGMLALSIFAAFHDPLSPTDEHYRPKGSWEWSVFALGLIGAVLLIIGAFL